VSHRAKRLGRDIRGNNASMPEHLKA